MRSSTISDEWLLNDSPGEDRHLHNEAYYYGIILNIRVIDTSMGLVSYNHLL